MANPTDAELDRARRVLDAWADRRTPEDHAAALAADRLLAKDWARRKAKIKRRPFDGS